MKKFSLRVLGIVFALCSLVCFFGLSASAASEVKSGDFIFSVGKSSATLVEYTGNSTKVTIPEKIKNKPVTAIGDYAFWQKKEMKTVSIPDSVKKIGEAAFNECTSLQKVILPEKLTTLKDAVFWYCTGLKSVVFNKGAKTFGSNIFRGCSKVTVYVHPGTKAENFVKGQGGLKYGYAEISSLKADKSLSIGLGATATIKSTYSPSVVYNSKLKYSVSDSSVASVSSKGVITPKKCGTCTVTVKTTDGSGLKAKVSVTVTPAVVEKITQSKVTATSYKLSWAKSEGATKYAVYKYNSSTKKWDKKTTSKTYYTFSSLKMGSTDKYKVKAYVKVDGKNIYSEAPKSFSFSVLKPGQVSTPTFVSSTTTSVKISWSKASNASGYQIFRYNTSNKSLSYIGSTTSLSYTVSKLTPNTEYRFVVKAYIKNGTEKYLCPTHSEANFTATKPIAPTGLKTTDDHITAKSILLSWNGVDGVSGYDVMFGKTGKDAETIRVNGADTTSLLVDNLDNGESYTFRIRAFTIRNGKEYSSDYSAEYTVKTKALPTSNVEALGYFSTALEKSALYKNSYSLFVTPKAGEISANKSSESISAVCDEIEASLTLPKQYHTFSNGVNQNGISLPQLISSKPEFGFTNESVAENSVDYSLNGSGFDLSFEMKDKTRCHFTPAVDFEAICANTGAAFSGVSYTTKILDLTKVKNGYVDMLEVEVSFNAILTVDGEDVGFTGSYTYLYVFVW